MSIIVKLKQLIATHFPVVSDIKKMILIRSVEKKQRSALSILKKKEVYRCVFLAIDISVWKYDGVFRLMMNNSRFEPIVLVCPMVNHGEKVMWEKMEQCISFYKEKGYNVVSSYDRNNHRFIDLRKELAPDILFYTNPYKGLIDDRYFITNHLDLLTVYVPYFLSNAKDINFSNNQLLHNLVWRNYLEFDFNLEVCKKYTLNRGKNAVVTGYPGIESLIDHHNYKDQFNGDKRKRIIWAPHHMLEAGKYGHSCFLKYANYMLDITKSFENEVIFIFKPHPLLRAKLYKEWGTKKTDEYYYNWSNGNNTTINEGDYYDLFLSSDAMIHDSGSFVVEYLYVNKPVMRTVNDVPLEEQFNEFALTCLQNYYMANNEADIKQFVNNVINGIDPLEERRTRFVHEVLMPKGSPSQNIITDIIDSIDNQIQYRN